MSVETQREQQQQPFFLGYHTVMDLYDCNQTILADVDSLQSLMGDVLKISGLSASSSKYYNDVAGLYGSIIVGARYKGIISVITYPEHKVCTLDIRVDSPDQTLSNLEIFFQRGFESKVVRKTYLCRGNHVSSSDKWPIL